MNKHHLKFAVFVVTIILAVVVVKVTGLGEYFDRSRAGELISTLQDFVGRHYAGSVVVYIAGYAVIASLLPAAFVMILIGGVLYGPFWGSVYALTGAGFSAAGVFSFSRYFAGNWLQMRFEDKLVTFNREFHKYGKWYLIGVRIIPIAPFFVLNLIAGLTRVRLVTFLWTTLLGSVPGILVIAILGRSLLGSQ